MGRAGPEDDCQTTTKAPDHWSGAFVLVVLDHSTEPSTVVLKMFLLFSSKV